MRSETTLPSVRRPSTVKRTALVAWAVFWFLVGHFLGFVEAERIQLWSQGEGSLAWPIFIGAVIAIALAGQAFTAAKAAARYQKTFPDVRRSEGWITRLPFLSWSELFFLVQAVTAAVSVTVGVVNALYGELLLNRIFPLLR